MWREILVGLSPPSSIQNNFGNDTGYLYKCIMYIVYYIYVGNYIVYSYNILFTRVVFVKMFFQIAIFSHFYFENYNLYN